MNVDPQTAPAATYAENTYYFCSQDCRDEFIEQPQSYVQQSRQ